MGVKFIPGVRGEAYQGGPESTQPFLPLGSGIVQNTYPSAIVHGIRVPVFCRVYKFPFKKEAAPRYLLSLITTILKLPIEITPVAGGIGPPGTLGEK